MIQAAAEKAAAAKAEAPTPGNYFLKVINTYFLLQ